MDYICAENKKNDFIMKKIYTLSLLLMSFVGAFAQTFYSENMGTPPAGNPLVTAYTGWQVTTVTYSGTASVRGTGASTGYSGASGAGNVFLNNAQVFEISGINTSLYSTANLTLTFGYKRDQGPAAPATNLLLEKSTDGTNWTALPYTPTGTAWEVITINNSLIPSTTNLRLRWTNIGVNPAQNQYRIDDIKLSNVSAACVLDLDDATTACNTVTTAIDNYTVSIPFTGGGTATYAMVATVGTIGGDNPSTTATGTITITNVPEGTNTSITVTGGDCNTTLDVTAISCKPVNTLPFNEAFPYQPGTLLGNYQSWREVNSGDSVIATAGNLTYTGINSTGYSVAFSGAGTEAYSPFTETATGTIYAAFLMNVTDMSNVTTDGTETYFAGLMSGTSTSSYLSRVWFKKNGAQYNVGFSTGATAEYSTTALNTGATALIVIGFNYATNTHSLWLNPTLSSFNASTPATLTVTPTTTVTETFGGFMLRQDSDTTTPFITIDELRIATSLDALSVRSNDIAGFTMYPNPLSGNVLNLTSASNASKTVEIYDVLGKQVINKSTDNNMITVDGLTAGIYMVKITEEGKTATRKLVVR